MAAEADREAGADPNVPLWGLKAFVTVTGAAVMAIEFSSQRLLAPFFGNSQLVWGVVIGLILLALSVGYHWGGRLADRMPRAQVLGGLVLGTGVFTAALPVLAEPLLLLTVRGVLDTPAGVVLGSLIGVAILFLPPVLTLGMVSPWAIRLAMQRRSVGDSGQTAGSLYAWATVGSLLGTFVPVFWTIPSFGVRATLWGAGAALILAGWGMTRRWASGLLLGAPLLFAHFAGPLLKPMPGLVTEVETPYQFAEVYQWGNGVALSVNDGAGIQSVYTPSRLTGLYYDAFVTLPYAFSLQRPLSALVLGMGAGTIPTMFRKDVDPWRHTPIRVTGVEIDPVLTALGQRYFDLKPGTAQVVHQDARVYLETHRQTFPLIVVDAYSNEIYIPFTLTTRQFFTLAAQHLSPDGMLALNVNALSESSPLLQDLERTLLSVFPDVAVARAPGAFNYLLVAARHPLKPPDPAKMPAFLKATGLELATTWHRPHPGPGLVFTDDRAPVDTLTDQMILSRLWPALSQSSSS